MQYPDHAAANECSISRRVVAAAVAALAMLAVVGCSSSPPPPGMKKLEKVELRFSVDQCQPIGADIFKCPAIDRPICNPDYNGQIDCVRIGPKGSVFIESAIGP
ncbi:MAG TPA: hypothetical protein VEU51_00745 [Candidatus Acidoferrales bacterium]|nr:hypothetical protein [Candidatus Acidoferrales bacterium]